MNAAIIEKIEDYLNGDIALTDLQQYAEELGIANLDEHIAWVKDAALAVEAEGVKSQIANLLVDAKPQPAKVVSMPVSRWIIGLAASLLLVVTAYFGIQNKSTDDQQQYAQYEYNDPGLPVVMSQSSNYAMYDALTYFGEQDYETAIAKFSALPSTSNDTVAYYLGASYHYHNNQKKAIDRLQKVAADPTSVFQQKAQWLLVLSYLRDEKNSQAKTLLTTISTDGGHQFQEQALGLLQEL